LAYTKVPRTTLWLLEGAAGVVGGGDRPLRRVELPSLYVGKSVITNAQYEAFDPGHGRPATSPGDDHPVIGVSLPQAQAYAAWYAALSGKAFRLPTDDEWEWACRGGTTGRWPWGDDPGRAAELAWTAESSDGRTHEIGTRRANPVGLHDTIGLAWEWTASPGEPPCLRGGSFRTPIAEIACFTRREMRSDDVADDAGLRIVRAP
jgi:formylglycine-generating enzyme required for sulfatase activity